MAPAATATRRGTLTRQLGLASVTALVIGEVISVGIFLTPASIPSQAALGAGVVGLGAPVYFLAVRRRLTPQGTAPNDLDSNHPTLGSG